MTTRTGPFWIRHRSRRQTVSSRRNQPSVYRHLTCVRRRRSPAVPKCGSPRRGTRPGASAKASSYVTLAIMAVAATAQSLRLGFWRMWSSWDIAESRTHGGIHGPRAAPRYPTNKPNPRASMCQETGPQLGQFTLPAFDPLPDFRRAGLALGQIEFNVLAMVQIVRYRRIRLGQGQGRIPLYDRLGRQTVLKPVDDKIQQHAGLAYPQGARRVATQRRGVGLDYWGHRHIIAASRTARTLRPRPRCGGARRAPAGSCGGSGRGPGRSSPPRRRPPPAS